MSFVSRAPGRVNLIGEHTDYSLLPVLPFAIQLGVTATARRIDEPVVRIDSATMPDPAVLRPGGGIDGKLGWHRYAQAAVDVVGETGVEISIDADLPSEGGLSSSSAFTVALVGVLRRAAGKPLDHDDVVAETIRAERATGVAGGAMDQNIIVRSSEGHAMRIDFAPFATQSIPVPETMAFVAAHSGEVAAKGGAAMEHYNDRVLGCHAAAELLVDMLGLDHREVPHLADVRGAGPEHIDRLPDEIEIAPGSRSWVTDDVVSPRAVPVRATAAHVLEEAARVDEAVSALHEADLDRLGQLLDFSHASLQRFGASTPALDRLAAALRDAGALGARLTGAGFGGYAIAVCSPSSVGAVVAAGTDAGGRAFEVRPSRGLQ